MRQSQFFVLTKIAKKGTTVHSEYFLHFKFATLYLTINILLKQIVSDRDILKPRIFYSTFDLY